MSLSKRRGLPRSFWYLALLVVLGSVFNVADSPAAEGPVIRVVSNRADLISGGDALVEVVLPQTTASAMAKAASLPALLDVRLNGAPVSKAFDVVNGIVDGEPAPRVLGLVKGLKLGKNVVTAELADGSAASIKITNHPITGPIFGGKQVTPWLCRTEENDLGAPLDAKCSGSTIYEYFYKSTDPLSSGLQAYDPASPPSDVATTTTDQGVTVPYIVRNERGTIDRGIYDIAILYDPSKPWTPTTPQTGWNGKVVYPFGGSSVRSTSRRPTPVRFLTRPRWSADSPSRRPA